MSAATVYVLTDEADVALYVGMSAGVLARIDQHRTTKEWWPQVVAARFEHFATREEAADREAVLIRDLVPLHNRAKPLVSMPVTLTPCLRFVSELRRVGLTDEEAALALGVSSKSVARWRRGLHQPRPMHVRRWADFFGRDFAWFYDRPVAA